MEIDDHNLHINEHIAFMLGGDYEKRQNETIKENFLKHIREHKQFLKLQNQTGILSDE